MIRHGGILFYDIYDRVCKHNQAQNFATHRWLLIYLLSIQMWINSFWIISPVSITIIISWLSVLECNVTFNSSKLSFNDIKFVYIVSCIYIYIVSCIFHSPDALRLSIWFNFITVLFHWWVFMAFTFLYDIFFIRGSFKLFWIEVYKCMFLRSSNRDRCFRCILFRSWNKCVGFLIG